MITGIIQARMGSTRLPGKVMMPINGVSILEHCIKRLSVSKQVDKWIMATTIHSNDDVIALFCDKIGIDCYRGSEEDVLDRFYQANQKFSPSSEIIVRICCDNPTHDGVVVDYCIDQFLKLGVDYFSNGNEPPFFVQDGITAEVFTSEAMSIAWRESTLGSQREHVTPYIKKSAQFKKAWRKFSDEFQFKLSVDNSNDFKLNEVIFQELGVDFSVNELIYFLKNNPQILEINSDSIINEGYLKSLREDKHNQK
jgi:spore coat polysaccharide biosynthesis protein SpsF